MSALRGNEVVACHHCHLVHVTPEGFAKDYCLCTRCGEHLLPWWNFCKNNTWAMLLVLAALAHYPFAMTLPILVVDEMGLTREINIIDGVQALFSSGKVFVGLIILAFSVVFPLGKIIGLYILSSASRLLRHSSGGRAFWLIELVGRWGMLDVFLVAVLLAMMKADVLELSAGPGLVAFTLCVVLSLLSAAFFDSKSIWEVP